MTEWTFLQKDSTRGEEEKHKVQCEEMGENSGHQNEKVMCDFCLEKPLPMVKSHLSCEMSLCPPGQAQHKGFPERPHPGGAL